MQRVKISITGIVQGVGFRPFVYNLARSMGMKGYVLNSSNGVTIDVEGQQIDAFIERMLSSPPALARIKEVDFVVLPSCEYKDFIIKESLDDEGITLISPDVCICGDCLNEIFDSRDRRHRYPFTNCTNCGPRYTIIKDIPYDREKTTMAPFIMCPECEREYHDPKNRRFHAQPNACSTCGPHVELNIKNEDLKVYENEEPIKATIEILKQGYIVAIKGIGGFHLCCDATNEYAVGRLRQRKRKSNKPFAIMAPDIKSIREFCIVDETEEKVLLSPEMPILLLEKLKDSAIAPSVSPNNRRHGVMLPCRKVLLWLRLHQKAFLRLM